MKLVECVANVSVGKNVEKVERLTSFFFGRSATLLHTDSHPDADRTVFTIACPLELALQEVLDFAGEVFQTVRVRENIGVHPHVGSLDVVPFVPLDGCTLDDTEPLARAFAHALWQRYAVPACFYGDLASNESQRRLHAYRRRGSKGLPSLIQDGLISLDEGTKLHEDHGLTLVSSRPLMLAYNISLDTDDTALARNIASQVRSHSQSAYKLESVEAIGWYMEHYGRAQISMNIRNPTKTPLTTVFARVKAVAGLYGVSVVGSEIIGLTPLSALTGTQNLSKHDIQTLVNTLGLAYHHPFVMEEKILEYRLQATINRGTS